MEHDPGIDSALQEAGWLRRLARSLVRDSERAEDAVQDTLVVALERSRELRSSPRGWLTTILRNRLLQDARARCRREERERQIPRPDCSPSAHDVSARLEVQALLVEAVRGLEEPYRATVVARFFDGLPPRAIARREGLSVRTVNTRLERGLSKLRARLDGKFGGERSGWLAALLPFAGPELRAPWRRLGEGLGMGATLKGVLGLAALVAAVWVGRAFLRRESDPSRTAALAEGSSRLGERAPAAGSPLEEGVAELPIALPGSRREEFAAPVTADDTCRIRVVSASSHAPVPNARLWIQREDVGVNSPGWTQAMRRFNDCEPLLQGDFGLELPLDAQGRALVPRPGRALLVVAACGELHGAATLESGDGECLVEMKAYHSLAVEVVDRSGRPVEGAYVLLLWGEFNPLANTMTYPTGNDGRVWIPKLEEQIWLEGNRGPVRLTLAGGVPCEPELVEFDLDSVPEETIRLVARDFGSVLLQLCDRRGRELALEGTAWLEAQWDAVLDPSLALRGGSSLYLPLDSGRALFPCVGLGLTFDAWAQPKAGTGEWREIRGPTSNGEELRVLIPLSEENRWASARGVVRAIDACLGESRMQETLLTCRARNGGSFVVWVREGEPFEVPIRNWKPVGGDEPWTVELSRTGGPVLQRTAVPSLDEAAGLVDFGELVFEPVPVLARVRVVGSAGEELGGSQVDVRSATASSTQDCDSQGLCILAGPLTELPLEVRASNRAWLPGEWTSIDPPGGETTLQLRPGATLEGRLLLPQGARLEDMELLLRSETSSPEPAAPRAEISPTDGRFRFAVCDPGRADLSVSCKQRVVLERASIELVGGQTTRLEPLDLRGALHPFLVHVELEGGGPPRGGHLELREPDGELSSWTMLDPAGRASFLATRTSLDLWVAARGARPRLFEGVLDGDTLTLSRAPSIVLQLSRELRLPEAPLALVCRAERVQPEAVPFETDDDVDVEEAVAGEDGSLRLEVPWPGDYELAWFVRHTGTDVEFPVEQAEFQTIPVADTMLPAVVEARLTRDELARAVLEAGG